MRHFSIALLLTASLAAQQPAQEAKPQPPAATAEAPAAPLAESNVTGSFEIGNRWITEVAGSLDAYRSVVNLGEGPKLLGAEFTVVDPKKRLFDRVEVRGYNWGDDPYSTFQLNARKGRLYRLDVDYRNIAYFNSLPSFANPLLDRGILLSQRSYDIRRRLANFHLDLLPGSWLIPYFAYERSAGEGRGVTTFVAEGNEYPVPNLLRDNAGNYRGGVRLEFRRAHVTLEQGGTTYHDDQQVYADGPRNNGNRTTPLLGQNLFLNNLQQSYRIRGSGIFSKGLFTANPVSWADIHGQFLYTLPSNDTQFEQTNSGNFWGGQNLFFNAEQFLLSASAKMPRSSGGLGGELRPMRRLRIITSWMTDRLHVSSAAQGRQTVAPAGSTPPAPVPQNALLMTNYSQEQVDAILDVTSALTLRAGYRYVWGNASSEFAPATGLANSESSKLERHVALAGFALRPVQKLQIHGDIEVAKSDSTYFRTSLRNYQKGRARARYQVASSFSVSADLSILNNQNPLEGIRYDFLSRQSSVSLIWSPNGGKRFGLQGDYTRATLRSNLEYIAPPFYQRERSFYRDNSHLSSVLLDLALPGTHAPKLSLGGSLVVTSGSRPTEYFQPLGKVSVPMHKSVTWVSQWRYYGFGETFYPVEAFRTHLITTGLLISR